MTIAGKLTTGYMTLLWAGRRAQAVMLTILCMATPVQNAIQHIIPLCQECWLPTVCRMTTGTGLLQEETAGPVLAMALEVRAMEDSLEPAAGMLQIIAQIIGIQTQEARGTSVTQGRAVPVRLRSASAMITRLAILRVFRCGTV